MFNLNLMIMNVLELKNLLVGKPDDMPVMFAIWTKNDDDDLLPMSIDEGGIELVNHVESETDFEALILLKEEK